MRLAIRGLRLRWPAALVMSAVMCLVLAAGCAGHRTAADPPDPPAGVTLTAGEIPGPWRTVPTWVPASLTAIGDRAEEVYRLILSQDWDGATGQFNQFRVDFSLMDAEVQDQDAYKVELASTINTLGRAILARDYIGALTEANDVTGVVAFMSEPLNPRVPVFVTLLGYHARSLQTAAAAGDTDRIAAAAAAIRRTWFVFRQRIVATPAVNVEGEADDAVSSLADDISVDNYARSAAALLQAVADMENAVESAPTNPQGVAASGR